MRVQILQKITSFFLIFFLLFSFTLRIPLETFFGYNAFAGDKDFYNLVSIIVDEDTYDEVRSKLVRYTRDIQGKLENTKVVILPTPSDASVLDIASLNESLYFEGYKAHKNVDFESRLIGTVLVGKIPVPVVFDDELSGKSILPYVDFENKSYVYNHSSQKYEKSDEADTKFAPEIWHGVISPNTGEIESDFEAIKDYFDKNHDFYTGAGVFNQDLNVIDGLNSSEPESYEPYVFYYDQFRESQALSYQGYVGHQMYLQNIEDITYNRYSKELAEEVRDQVLGVQNSEITDLLLRVDPDFDVSTLSSGPDASSSPDVLTRYITDNTTKKFLEIFNGSTIGDMRKHVFNAGRYNDGGSRVNMDMPPFLISVLDSVSSEVIKNVNTSLENEITDVVTGGLARDISIPLEIKSDANISSGTGNTLMIGEAPSCGFTDTGFIFGKPVKDITNASECTIYRGNTASGTLVESNRGYNVNYADSDAQLCGLGMTYDSSSAIITGGLEGFWGGNSPINLSSSGSAYQDFTLGARDELGGIRPLYDALGSKQVSDTSKNPSPLDCFENPRLIRTYQGELYTVGGGQGEQAPVCGTRYSLPVSPGDAIEYYTNAFGSSGPSEGSPRGTTSRSRFCGLDGGFAFNFQTPSKIFPELYKDFNEGPEGSNTCVDQLMFLGSEEIGRKYTGQNCMISGNEADIPACCPAKAPLKYKKISSHILHTSPTDTEFGAQINSLFTPSLPIDSDRYIDFIGAKGGDAPDYGYARIDFPQLFRVVSASGSELTLESISEATKQYLDDVSENMNRVIRLSDPSSLTNQDDIALYEELKTGEYPADDIDLYQLLQDKPLELFTLDNQSKQVSYYDTLVFAIYWNNLKTVSAKYKFIFQNYLSNQFEGNEYNFHLPKSKKSYETAYLAAPGDESNMYVTLDPEKKGVHPYADILARNLELSTIIAASNVGPLDESEGTFECAPPDGVNIFQWIPAVICWLKEMLPPTIKISDGSCGLPLFSDEQREEIAECSTDLNNNGIIDCLEEKLASGSLLLSSDSGRYYYNSAGVLTTQIFDDEDEIAFFDSNSYVKHELIRVDAPVDANLPFNSSNSQVIYDRDDDTKNSQEARGAVDDYLVYNEMSPKALRGKADAYFYGKSQDTNAYFESTLVIVDAGDEIVVDLKSDILRVEIRGERLLAGAYIVESSDEYYAGSEVRVSEHNNLCLSDGNQGNLTELTRESYSLSEAPEKLLFNIENISLAGNRLPLNYPLDITLKRGGNTVFEEKNLTEQSLSRVTNLFQAQVSGEYELYVRDANDFVAYKNIYLIPEKATEIKLVSGTNIVETGGNISTHFITLHDRFDNVASGEIYTVSASISGEGIEFEDGEKSTSYTLAEGYKVFRIRSTGNADNNTITLELKDLAGEVIDSVSQNIKSVENIEIRVTPMGETPKVGGDSYGFDVEFVDAQGAVFTDLNSRVYLGVDRFYGKSNDIYSDVINGKSQVTFITSTLAGKNIFLEFQLEGGNEIYKEKIDILPDAAMRVDIALSKDKMEASSEDSSILEAVLKDRYNNDVFTDSTTTIDIEVADKSSDIITVSTPITRFTNGNAQFIISGTQTPGIGYFKVQTDPDLSTNSFDISGQVPFDSDRLVIPAMKTQQGGLTSLGNKFYKRYSEGKFVSLFPTEILLTQSEAYFGLPESLREQVVEFWRNTNSLVVSGIGENAGSIETFFFWGADDIDENAYNGMYSVLLGAPYGDVSKENYLAGSLLFDRENSSLAVTSLLNNPYSFFDIASLSSSGALIESVNGDITQDIQVSSDIDDEGRIFLDIYNNALETYIGRVYYVLDTSDGVTLSLDNEDSGYTLRFLDEAVQILSPEGQIVFVVGEEGTFERKLGSYITRDDFYTGAGLGLEIFHAGQGIGKIEIEQTLEVNITRDDSLLENKLRVLENTMLLHLSSKSYSSRQVSLPDGNTQTKLYYHDPFGNKYSLNELHNSDGIGLESSYDETGIGWQEPNMMLLQFSAGESVGESTKNHHSFSLINLGDPVTSLKPHDQEFTGSDIVKSFDSTLGSVLVDEPDILYYQIFDYNADGRHDILTVHSDGYLSLYEGDEIHGDFIKQRRLIFAADGGMADLVKTGDFSGDGYSDVFFVSQSGTPELYNNVNKDFIRQDINEYFSLSGSLVQVEVFDMDSDGKDDIVSLDDAGEVHIFYGGGSSSNPEFTKKYVGDGYGIQLSESEISQGGAIYYEGLTSIGSGNSNGLLELTDSYLQSVTDAVANTDPDEILAPEFINEGLVNNLLYVQVPYMPTDFDAPEIAVSEVIVNDVTQQTNELGPDAQEQGVGGAGPSLSDFFDNYDAYVDYSGYETRGFNQEYFLRSQYADTQGIEILKTFTDTTPPYLQTGDRVYFDITLRNTSSVRKDNVAYVDRLPKYFKFTDENFIVLTDEDKSMRRQPGIGNYNIFFDGFYLDPGETLTVRYELETLPLSYGFMQVGLYEFGEVGDDIYGDIILKEDEKNCGLEAQIYRSTGERSYIEGTTTPVCDRADLEIGNTFPQLTDDNDNGVPDYLEQLVEVESNLVFDGGGLSGQALADAMNEYQNSQEYQTLLGNGSDALSDLYVDSDGDQIPDIDDSMDSTSSAIDFMGAISNINASVDDIAAEIDEIIEGLSCGFGGGSCFANPLNWAPLAPGNDPTLFGMPVGDGLRVNEGVPVFSALTGRQTSCGTSPCCLPSVYPASSATFVPGPFCGGPGAGGSLGTTSPTNFVRMFVTPTLTGAGGIAVCFGGPAIVRGNLPPPGVSPVAPGGNCIVAAMPLFGCEGGEGDPGALGYPVIGDFGVIHANCDGNVGQDLVSPRELSGDFIEDYFQYLETGAYPATMYDNYVSTFSSAGEYGGNNFTLPTEPLINIGSGEGMMSTSVDLDLSAIGGGDFNDVIDINNKSIGGFPNFFMDWVERQLDEVTSKLTNLPKVFVILPDFGGIFDGGFDNFGQGLTDNFNKGSVERQENRNQRAAESAAIKQTKVGLDCDGEDLLTCKKIDLQAIAGGGQNFVSNTNERLSGIKQVYDFVGNIPLVNIESETISVNVPWIEATELNRFIADWELTAEQWKNEVTRASAAWSIGASCSGTPAEIERCQRENDIREKAQIDANAFVSSLERNIEVLHEYKEFPEKLSKLINIKEVWLEQILCNIEAISTLMGEWIKTNGERFKAWVELYMLIKAILKSWQLFIDVFNDYEAECHECKNERQDLNTFVFRLISMVIPSPPIIEFPKWPDIILDFHNIRAGMTIYMPDFELNLRPIVLPTLPKLGLPDVPSANLNLPELPVLPTFEIPELPELPSLPTIELPDLPPPPKIPKLFGPVEIVLNIAKLVTKAMCILKQSPFVPEWRAGDQIAFLTERNGYLPTDFIDVQFPTFSYSAISAIKVTTYVNFEFETDAIIEAVRAITAPIDNMTNNIVNMFDIKASDIDLRGLVPEDINIDVESDGEINSEISLINKEASVIAGLLASEMLSFLKKLQGDENIFLDNREFTRYINTQLVNPSLLSDDAADELRAVWKEVSELTYSQQDEFISEMAQDSQERFRVLGDILSTEIEYTKNQQKSLETITTPEAFIQVEASSDNRIQEYGSLLEPYNIKTIDAALGLLGGESRESKNFREDLDSQAKQMMQEVRGGLTSYRNNLLADHTPGHSSPDEGGTCIGSGAYEYRYEGIYVLEDDKNYKLFDYTDILKGDEVPKIIDLDKDGDQDVLYLAKGRLYFKENRGSSEEKEYFSTPPLILAADDNKFYNGDTYYEAVNGFRESGVSDGTINIAWQSPSREEIKNYRIEYHTIVDKYLDETDSFTPRSVKTHIIDGVSDILGREIVSQSEEYIVQNHIATLIYAGAVNGLTLRNEKLVNIKDQIEENTLITLTRNTALYAGGDDFTITYKLRDNAEEKELRVRKYTQISFSSPTEILSLRGDAYISTGIFEDILDTDIIDYIGKPILPGAKVMFDGNQELLSESSHLDIRYYDGSEYEMDVRSTHSYTLYNLGDTFSDEYVLRLKIPNDFYYARIHSFHENISSTLSKQILLSPQVQSDTFAPQIGLAQKIRIPVYQQREVDLTPYLYEDGGLGNIKSVSVDFDLNNDADGDGDPRNDLSQEGIDINITPIKVGIIFGPYETLFEKNIMLMAEDNNGNVGYREVAFEVYTPNPSIESVEETIISGAIDESLLQEPVRLYRYRGGVVEKLEGIDGTNLIETDEQGNYDFEIPESPQGVSLIYSGSNIAQINEYTGKIDIQDLLSSVRVLPSNSENNTSVYPEIQITRLSETIYRQFIKIPEGEASLVQSLNNLEETGMYLKLIDQENYGSFRVPLGVSYNPGSISIYASGDTTKTPVMSVFIDGRVYINEDEFTLQYSNYGDDISLTLVDESGDEIAQLVYHMQASFILR